MTLTAEFSLEATSLKCLKSGSPFPGMPWLAQQQYLAVLLSCTDPRTSFLTYKKSIFSVCKHADSLQKAFRPSLLTTVPESTTTGIPACLKGPWAIFRFCHNRGQMLPHPKVSQNCKFVSTHGFVCIKTIHDIFHYYHFPQT